MCSLIETQFIIYQWCSNDTKCFYISKIWFLIHLLSLRFRYSINGSLSLCKPCYRLNNKSSGNHGCLVEAEKLFLLSFYMRNYGVVLENSNDQSSLNLAYFSLLFCPHSPAHFITDMRMLFIPFVMSCIILFSNVVIISPHLRHFLRCMIPASNMK